MPAVPQISATVCTHNRAAYLRKALQSLVAQSLPRDRYEILVIDNASTDDTAVVCAEFEGVRRIEERRLGLNIARNTGWRQAAGKYVAYLDDDAVACREWLDRIVRTFESVQPKPGCVGGKVDLLWEETRPTWLGDEFLSHLCKVDLLPSAGWVEYKKEQYLIGCNIAFDRSLLVNLGGFLESLDRKGSGLLSNGDILIEIRIREAGMGCYYHPGMTVDHHVSASRLTPKWFLRRFYWQGVSDALMDRECSHPSYGEGLRRGWKQARARQFGMHSLRRLLRSSRDVQHLWNNCLTMWGLGFLAGYSRWHG